MCSNGSTVVFKFSSDWPPVLRLTRVSIVSFPPGGTEWEVHFKTFETLTTNATVVAPLPVFVWYVLHLMFRLFSGMLIAYVLCYDGVLRAAVMFESTWKRVHVFKNRRFATEVHFDVFLSSLLGKRLWSGSLMSLTGTHLQSDDKWAVGAPITACLEFFASLPPPDLLRVPYRLYSL